LLNKNPAQIMGEGLVTHDVWEDLRRRFSHHPPLNEEVAEAHNAIRQMMRAAASVVITNVPGPSREQSLALTALEEAMMWANAGIARAGSDG
jgi:hypothetical protein